MISAAFCALQGTMHLVKYLNILDFNENNPDKVEYDRGCLSGTFTDSFLAEARKAKICPNDASCSDQSSNWTFLYLLNAIVFLTMALNFLLFAISACSAFLRSVAGVLFCLTGPAYLYAIHQTYSNSSM